MSVRSLLAAALFTTATVAAAAEPSVGTPANVAPAEPQVQQRRPERGRPAPAPLLRPRTMEAPGAALMLIPASYTPR